MNTTFTYRIESVGRSVAGDELLTVVQYKDGVALGGDHRWVRREFAERAVRLYETDAELHGATSAKLGARYWATFSERMFRDATDEEG